MRNIADFVKSNDSKTIFIWHSGKIIKNLAVFQVYGFCLNKKGEICLVRDKNEARFTLPGGRVKRRETAEEALVREFEEEAQFKPEEITLLGSLEVKVINKKGEIAVHHQQARFICKINSVPDFIPGKDGRETEERIFVKPSRLPDYIDWLILPAGRAQLSNFLKYLKIS